MTSQNLTGEYNKLLEEIVKIESRLGNEGRVDPYRKISQILDIMDSAKSSIDIVGINATGPVHQGKEALTKVLKNGGTATISVLDYRDEVFYEREKKEKDLSNRMRSELAATFAILDDVYNKVPTISRLEIYFHKFPKAALVIGDSEEEEAQMQVNVYPEDARGLTGRTYLLKKKDGDAFKAGYDFYASLLSGSERASSSALDLFEYRLKLMNNILKGVYGPK